MGKKDNHQDFNSKNDDLSNDTWHILGKSNSSNWPDQSNHFIFLELKPVRTFLKVVTVKEEQKTKRTIQKHFEQEGLKKHEDFAMVNLQSVIDSYHIRDEDQVDDSITSDFLFELEWELTQENRKPFPQFLKGPLVFLIFCATVLNLLYTTLAGAQLIVASLQEWLVCFFSSLICFVILECITSIIVGYCDMTHIKHWTNKY